MTTDFITALTKELHAWQDDTQFITYAGVRELLVRAASSVIANGPLPHVTLRHEYEPGDLVGFTILEIDGEYVTTLAADDVAGLRALLMTWDENRPAQVGDTLGMPTRLKDGTVLVEVTQELLGLVKKDGER